MPADLSNEKRALRAELRERRRILPTTERDAATAALTDNLRRLTTDLAVRSVAGYLSRQDEPNIRPFVRWARDAGSRVLLPVSREDGLLDWAPYDGGEEALDPFGMPAPTSELLSPMAIGDVNLILAPAAAVDVTGMRLGWGRGY